MSKTVLLVGHCGPDNSYLKLAVRSAAADVSVVSADDEAEFRRAMDNGSVDLILFNRELGYGFDDGEGVEMIRWMRKNYPSLRMMLVSNYPEAQAAAVEAGAMPGFGKNEIGTPRVTQLLRSALEDGEDDL